MNEYRDIVNNFMVMLQFDNLKSLNRSPGFLGCPILNVTMLGLASYAYSNFLRWMLSSLILFYKVRI